MDGIYSLWHPIQSYMEIGGITMYPLLLCCLWMWGKIFYHLHVWQTSFAGDKEKILGEFSQLQGDTRRHNRGVLEKLLQSYEAPTRRGIATIKVLAMVAPFLALNRSA